MSKAVRVRSGSVLFGTLIVGTILVLLTGALFADTAQTNPHRILLNAQGNTEDVFAIMPMSIGGGYLLTEANGTLSLNGEAVAEAISIRYSYIDDSLVVSFDRDQLLGNPSVTALAGTMVTATVEGSFTAANSDGDSHKQTFRRASRKLLTL